LNAVKPRAVLATVKACPHRRTKVRASPNSALALSRRFLRQSRFSATEWTGLRVTISY